MEKCIECGTKLVGRSDKKFCDSNCRNAYHNEKSKPVINTVRLINRSLANNRAILEKFSLDGIERVSIKVLRSLGFEEKLFTSRAVCPKGKEVTLIYDQAYHKQMDEIVILKDGTDNFRPTG